MRISKFFILLPVVALFAIMPACTNLDDIVEDGIGRDVVDDNLPLPPDAAAALRGVYNQITGLASQDNTFALLEHPSDEMMGPTRGTDWSDFGVWRQLHTHDWDGSHTFVISGWNQMNSGIFQATQTIAAAGSNARVAAEARFLRAYFMYIVVDLYGSVPFREATEGVTKTPKVYTRTEATNLIIADLEAALPNLPNYQDVDPGVANKDAANALLAKVYLNKPVFTAATPAGPYTFAAADMQKVIQYADAIINSGRFQLTDYWDNFTADNSTKSREMIFAIVNQPGNSRGNLQSRHRMTTHYNQNPSGWNGFTTVADFYNKWTANGSGDVRKGAAIPGVTTVSGIRAGFLEGQQKDQNGANLTDRGGNPLAFTVDVDLLYSNERQGVRCIKYPPDFTNVDNPGNDYILLRYADVLLMKAEALFRTGNSAGALTIINQIRTQRGATPIASIAADGQQILDERGFELYWEGWRRSDQIRFGQFLKPWASKPQSNERAVLFPIPQIALDNNPNLKQNPGY
jgi:hypothetical protein